MLAYHSRLLGLLRCVAAVCPFCSALLCSSSTLVRAPKDKPRMVSGVLALFVHGVKRACWRRNTPITPLRWKLERETPESMRGTLLVNTTSYKSPPFGLLARAPRAGPSRYSMILLNIYPKRQPERANRTKTIIELHVVVVVKLARDRGGEGARPQGQGGRTAGQAGAEEG